MKSDMTYEQFTRMVERFEEQASQKYKNTGITPPKLKVRDTTRVVNANIDASVYDALTEASKVTGMTQRALIEKCLLMGLNQIVHSHTKTVSFWQR